MADTPPRTLPEQSRAEKPRLTAEVFEHREQRAAYGTDPTDALPRQVAETSYDQTYVPPLSPETLVCMADARYFRLLSHPDPRTADRELARFTVDEVQCADGRYWVPYQAALARVGEEDHSLVSFNPQTGLCAVYPLRYACKHYLRQLTDFEGDPERKFLARFCTALRDSNGEYQSLRDTIVYACELRDPRDATSARMLDDFDTQLVQLGRERTAPEHEFDVDAELAGNPAGGIFSGK